MRRRGELVRVGGKLGTAVSNAQQDWDTRESLLYCVTDEQEDRVGLGEAAPLPGFSSDRTEDSYLALQSVTLPDTPLSIEVIRSCVETLPPALPAARYALECALLDLLAQRERCSIASLLGADASHASRCALLTMDTALISASHLAERGVTTAKLKVGRSWPDELGVIRALRTQYPSLQLRLDANGAWSVPEAQEYLGDLCELSIQFVEQPVHPEDMDKLQGVPIPLAADESMRDRRLRDILIPLINDKSLVAIVVKPTVLGGLLACMDLARWAKAHGLATIASHTFEGPVGSAGVAELACATQGRFAAGLDEHPGLTIAHALKVPQLAGFDISSFSPGLGLRWPL